MQVDTVLPFSASIDTRQGAAAAESAGYAAVWTGEVKHDPFLALGLAAVATESIRLGTSIALAFARNPMSTAVQANDLQALSGGRLLLGLGSQIRAHITRRFGMPWSHPAPRMREYILAMRAIWECWNSGTKLDFRGDFYTHTLMTPFFDPGPNPHGAPAVLLAGVGDVMTAVAGEVADGFLCHGFTTERYLREVTVPALERGRAGRAGDERCLPRGARADRVLRLDAGLPARARAARLGRALGRAAPALAAGTVEGDGRLDRRERP
jgi:probable F420-dependent oxidoreductase